MLSADAAQLEGSREVSMGIFVESAPAERVPDRVVQVSGEIRVGPDLLVDPLACLFQQIDDRHVVPAAGAGGVPIGIGQREHVGQKLVHPLHARRLGLRLVRLLSREPCRPRRRDDACEENYCCRDAGRRGDPIPPDELRRAVADRVGPRHDGLTGEVTANVVRELIDQSIPALGLLAKRHHDDGIKISLQPVTAGVGRPAGHDLARTKRRRVRPRPCRRDPVRARFGTAAVCSHRAPSGP